MSWKLNKNQLHKIIAIKIIIVWISKIMFLLKKLNATLNLNLNKYNHNKIHNNSSSSSNPKFLKVLNKFRNIMIVIWKNLRNWDNYGYSNKIN